MRSLFYALAFFGLLSMGCANAAYFEGENGRILANSSALGQSLAYSCKGATISGAPEELLTALSDMANREGTEFEEIIRQIGFTQLPSGDGLCVVARGGPIDQEVQGIMKAWLWSVGIGAASDVLGDAIDLGQEALK